MIRHLLVGALVLFIQITPVIADEISPQEHRSIPYKSEDGPLQEHGSRIGWVVIGFLFLAWGGTYYLRKKGAQGAHKLFNRNPQQLKILDRQRLDARATLYVVEFDQKKFLIGQTGESITTLAESDGPSSKSADHDA